MFSKNVFLSLLAIMFMSVNMNAQTEESDYSWEKIDDRNQDLKKLKTWYLTNQKNVRPIENTSFKESYLVTMADRGIKFFSIEINEGLKLPNDFKVKSHLIDASFIDSANYPQHLIFVQRIIEYNGGSMIEIVNVTNGNIIGYHLENISDEFYLDFTNTNIVTTGNTTICFKSFDSCINHIKLSNEQPLNAAICDFLPCNAFAYVTCKMAGAMGYIGGGSGCDVVY